MRFEICPAFLVIHYNYQPLYLSSPEEMGCLGIVETCCVMISHSNSSCSVTVHLRFGLGPHTFWSLAGTFQRPAARWLIVLLGNAVGSGATSSSSFFAPCSEEFGLTGRDGCFVFVVASPVCAGAPMNSDGISSVEEDKVDVRLHSPVDMEVEGLAG